MKYIGIFLILLFNCLQLTAQQNLYDSVKVVDKFCRNYNIEGRYSVRYFATKANIVYATRVYSVNLMGDGNTMLIKLNNNFDTVWTKSYGGSENDLILKVLEMPNGDLLTIGTTESTDGDLSFNTIPNQLIWLQILDTNGNIKKARVLGAANGGNYFYGGAYVANNGDIYLGGGTGGNDGDLMHIGGGSVDQDAFIVKLDTSFNIKWTKFITSTSEEGVASISNFEDKIIFATQVIDSNGTLTLGDSTRGYSDALITLIDANSNTIWSKRFGSRYYDVVTSVIYNPLEHVIYFAGYSSSFSGDIDYKTLTTDSLFTNDTPPVSYTNRSLWIQTLDTLGKKNRSCVYGDSDYNSNAYSWGGNLYLFNNQVYVCGFNGRGGGPVYLKDTTTAPNRYNNFNTYIFKLNKNAEIIGKHCIIGNDDDMLFGFFEKDNHLHAYGGSGNYFRKGNNLSCDTNQVFSFILKLANNTVAINNSFKNTAQQLIIVPNPAQQFIQVQVPPSFGTYNIYLYNTQGTLVKSYFSINNFNPTINIFGLPAQQYLLQAINIKGESTQGRFVVN